MNQKISIIVATDEKRGIAKKASDSEDGKYGLMWHIPEELKRFKSITTGHPIIMGRKTYESMGRILPNRTNIIITRDPKYSVEGGVVVHSLEEAIEVAKTKEGSEEIFVIGGGQIYEQSLSLADKLYLTIVKGDFKADTFFPEYPEFKETGKEGPYESNGHTFTFYTFKRN
jgi:dihydrofolate reductase